MALVRPAITPSQVRRLYQPGISLTDAKINIVKYLRGRVVRWGRYRCVTLTSCYICQAPGELINTTTVRIKMCAPPPPTGDISRGVYFPNFGEGLRGKIRIFQPFHNQFQQSNTNIVTFGGRQEDKMLLVRISPHDWPGQLGVSSRGGGGALAGRLNLTQII